MRLEQPLLGGGELLLRVVHGAAMLLARGQADRLGRGARAGRQRPEEMPDGRPAPEIEVLLATSTFDPPPDSRRRRTPPTPPSTSRPSAIPRAGGRAGRASSTGPSRGSKVLDWDPPWAKWFVGGKLNVSHNCLDRHVDAGLGERVAYHWEGEDGEQPHDHLRGPARHDVALRERAQGLGVERDDRVAIYLPMIPEAPAAMLACARIGAPHSVVFGGFSAEAVKDRINDCEAKVLVTADFSLRRGKPLPMKESIDGVLDDCPSIEHVVVVRRTGGDDPVDRGPRRLVARAGRGRRRPTARPSRSTPSRCCTCSTRPARRRSRRASSTRAAAT